MTVRYLKKYAALEGIVSVDDAEPLAQWLIAQKMAAVHLGKCDHVHGAVLQVLLALRPKVVCAPADPMLAGVISMAPPA